MHTAYGLAEVGGTAHVGNLVGTLVNVEVGIGRGQDFAFVDHIDAHGLEDPSLAIVSNSGFGHHGDGRAVEDALNHVGVAHAGHAACLADVRRNALEGHHGDRPGVLGHGRLLGIDDVHDDAALLHASKATLDQVAAATHVL